MGKRRERDWSLTQVLASLGYTHQKSANPQHLYFHDVQRDGVTVFSGRAGECWTWLREKHPADERGAFCWNSRLWLFLRAFAKPPSCPNEKQFHEKACRGCGYFEVREPTSYLTNRLEMLQVANASSA